MSSRLRWMLHNVAFSLLLVQLSYAADDYLVTGCEGYVQVASTVSSLASTRELDYSAIKIKLLSSSGVVKDQTECAPNGYYFIPVTEKGSFSIAVEGPKGWSFEPDRRAVTIGKDGQCHLSTTSGTEVNFEFIGFSILGRVVAEGCGTEEVDMKGIKMNIIQEGDGVQVGTTHTDRDGTFRISKLFPGKYKIIAEHPKYTFKVQELSIDLQWGNLILDRYIEISGYDVIGKIDYDGESSHTLTFELLNESSNNVEHTARADSLGNFQFKNVKCGSYRASLANDDIPTSLRISPSSVPVVVRGGSHITDIKFQVAGFSVKGRVVTSWGTPIYNASVHINHNNQIVLTDSEGRFTLEDLRNGKFVITVAKEHYHFNHQSTTINPSSPSLPDIVPSGLDVCGQLSALGESSTKKEFNVHFKSSNGHVLHTTKTNSEGSFCFSELKAGEYPEGTMYSVEPLLSTHDAVFNIEQHVFYLKDSPITDILFSESQLHISGEVKRLSESTSNGVYTILLKHSSTTRRTETDNLDSFHFDNTPPGEYNLQILGDGVTEPCWEQDTLVVRLNNKNISDLSFVQSGYRININTTNSCTLSYSINETKKENIPLTKGLNSYCVDKPGLYNINISSCYVFSEDTFTYDTSTPSVKNIHVSHYLVGGTLTYYNNNNTAPITLLVQGQHEQQNITAVYRGQRTYHYSFKVASGETVKIRAIDNSKESLSYPEYMIYNASHHSSHCLPSPASFTFHPGYFINGKVTPETSLVEINIYEKEDDRKSIVTLHTDSTGGFRAGPFRKDIQLIVKAEKKGYSIDPNYQQVTTNNEYISTLSFNAAQLGRIDVHIEDEKEKKKIGGVLLTLSGQGFRAQNNITNNNDTFTFWALLPNQYFLRPQLKEYTFSPNNVNIKLNDGEQKKITIYGNRVSFSSYGYVLSLNNIGIEGLTIQCSSNDENHIEEATTDHLGFYRCRALKPNHKYIISILNPSPSNTGIRRVPHEIELLATTHDSFNNNFTIHRYEITYDMTAHIHAQSVDKVEVIRNNGQSLGTRHVGPSGFIRYSGLNKGIYTILVYSSTGNKYEERVTLTDSMHVNIVPQFITHHDDILDNNLTSFSSIIFVAIIIFSALNFKKIMDVIKKWRSNNTGREDESWIPKIDKLKSR